MTTIDLNGWQVQIITNADRFIAIKGYTDIDGFNAVRNLGTFRTRSGAERAARRAVAR